VQTRPIRADDTERLRAFHARLSPDTIYLRCFSAVPVLMPHMAERLTHVDYENRMVLVTTPGAGDDEQIVAAVRYVGGRIWLESTGVPGEGTVITFTLPLASPGHSAGAPQVSRGAAGALHAPRGGVHRGDRAREAHE
jgi:hypothetical protein